MEGLLSNREFPPIRVATAGLELMKVSRQPTPELSMSVGLLAQSCQSLPLFSCLALPCLKSTP